MTNRSALIVLFRMVMIFLSLQIVTTYLGVLTGTQTGLTPSGKFLLPVVSVVEIGIFVLAIRFADRIVDLLNPVVRQATDGENGMSLDQLQAVAFSAAGAVLTFVAIQNIFLLIAIIEQTFSSGYVPYGSLANVAVTLVLGAYLLFGAPGLRQWLISIRRPGRNNRE